MVVRGKSTLEGVGGDILNPRDSGGAYDDMLRSLHDVMDASDGCSSQSWDAMTKRDWYHHLDGIVDGADDNSYADLSFFTWPRKDWEAKGGKFFTAEILGANPMYQLNIDVRRGAADFINHEQTTKRRVGQRALVGMTRNMTYTDLGNRPDDRWLSNGYAIVPETITFGIRQDDGEVTGDSVRRALEPYEEHLAAIATSLATEAERSISRR